jgi:hypothetical protein
MYQYVLLLCALKPSAPLRDDLERVCISIRIGTDSNHAIGTSPDADRSDSPGACVCAHSICLCLLPHPGLWSAAKKLSLGTCCL